MIFRNKYVLNFIRHAIFSSKIFWKHSINLYKAKKETKNHKSTLKWIIDSMIFIGFQQKILKN